MLKIIVLWSAALGVEHLVAQEIAPLKTFEVISIRPIEETGASEHATADPRTRNPQISGGLLKMPDERMERILQRAFGLPRPQIVAPEWTATQRFSIAAKLPDGASQQDVPEMLRSMLVERFQMVSHKEIRSTPALILSLAKGGIKAETAPPDSHPRGRPIGHGGMHYELTMTSAKLAEFLSEGTFAPVVDRTGLAGVYLFTFDFYLFGRLGEDGKPLEPPTGDIFADLARNYGEALSPLGLRLTPSKVPLENIIIDRLDRRPTEN